MNANRAAELLQIEKECIQRQDTPKCCRYTEGCAKCDLVQDSNDLLEAYDFAIDAIRRIT